MKDLHVSDTSNPKHKFLIPVQVQYASGLSNVSCAILTTLAPVLILRSCSSMLRLHALKDGNSF